MKLTAKLVILFLAITSLLLAADSYLTLRRERSFFLADLKRDAELLAGAVQRVVEDVGGAEGLARALELIDDLNRRQRRLRVRWVWLDASSGEGEGPRDSIPASARTISETEITSFSARDADGRGYFHTYSPAGRAPSRSSSRSTRWTATCGLRCGAHCGWPVLWRCSVRCSSCLSASG